jgi:hypothetical protein
MESPLKFGIEAQESTSTLRMTRYGDQVVNGPVREPYWMDTEQKASQERMR